MTAFGMCCEDLRQSMHNKEGSMFRVDEGVLSLTIGIVPMAKEVGHFTKPIRFCPFCGTELQSANDIQTWYQTR
jgi:NADH pyrophosphatase NudC (nudix superfamily)